MKISLIFNNQGIFLLQMYFVVTATICIIIVYIFHEILHIIKGVFKLQNAHSIQPVRNKTLFFEVRIEASAFYVKNMHGQPIDGSSVGS